MYQTYLEVLEATLAKYENAQALSKGMKVEDENGSMVIQPKPPGSILSGCYYRHSVNGIGCAIGCHLSDENAIFLEDSGVGAGYIFNMFYDEKTIPVLRAVFAESITPGQLQELQEAHDRADNVENFRYQLRQLIEREKVHVA